MSPRRIARHATLAFIAHGVLVVSVLALDRRPQGANIYGWDAVKILRFGESPILWAIDGILASVPLVPLGWFRPHFELAYAVNTGLAYILVGGTFYAALVAGVSAWLERRKLSARTAAVPRISNPDLTGGARP